jgi:dihydroorotase-like cyclic amidohydrolase
MRLAAKFIKPTNKPHAVHAEDKYLIESRRLEFQSNNRNEWRHYCLTRDPISEEKAIKDMIKIAAEIGGKVHIVHLSSELGLISISKAQQEGVNITSETCPHYLYFTQDDFENEKIRNYLKTSPPVKMEKDKKALWQGLKVSTLSFVTTDHAGCDPIVEKSEDNFWKVYGGIPGVEHRVPFLFSEGFIKEKLSFEQTVNLLSKNVAEYFNLENKGIIKEGFDADFAVLNLWDWETVRSNNMHSKGKYTPFEGTEFNCIVEKTILRGKVIMDRVTEVEEKIGYGKFIEIRA